MPQKCSICNHENRKEIEKAVASGVPLRKIVERWGGSTGSIDRHTRNCITKAINQVKTAKQELLDEQTAVTVETIREGVAEQVRNGTLQTAVTIESTLNQLFEGVNKLWDACDNYLDDPANPGAYTLDSRASEVRIIWEELADDAGEGKPKWIKKSGSLQEALALAFSNGDRKLVKVNPIKFSDPRELLLKTADRLSTLIEILAKLEGRYRPVEKELGQGNQIQLAMVVNILVQNGLLKG